MTDALVIRRDPVCGMTPKPDTPYRAQFAGEEVLFCSAGCKSKFEADPAAYVASSHAHHHDHAHHHHADRPPVDPTTVPAGAKWTCPMHPEVIKDGPGACPICGMALEPMTPTAETAPNPELADMTRRFWIGLALSIPVMLLELGAHLFGWQVVPPHWSPWVQFALATPVVLWAGWPFFVRGWQSVVNRGSKITG